MRSRLVCPFVLAFAFANLAALAARAPQTPQTPTRWTDLAPVDAGFIIQAPGALKDTPDKPGHHEYLVGESSFIVDVDRLDDLIQRAVAARNSAALTTYLTTLRDRTMDGMKAVIRSSASADFDGHPSVLFSFGGTIAGRPFEGRQRIVLTADRQYFVLAIGFSDELKTPDVDRFFKSLRLVKAPPLPAAVVAAAPATRTISFTDMVCGWIPPVAITFDVPSDFAGRRAGSSSDGGCLWGVKDDLDHALADPSQGDFTDLRRGIFRARLSTNVVCSAAGVFDQMDGSGETGIRQQLEASGATVVVWKKGTTAGLPALQIVADAFGGRVYMLYLGNTQYISNTMLLNYYTPGKRTAADDDLWARFMSGIRKAG